MNNLQIKLEPRSIAACPEPNLPPALLAAFNAQMLQHQVEVYHAAAESDIVLDLAATGTGKTKAGLSVLWHNRNRNAIYIAPTNALIEQQTAAAEKFIQEAGLPHLVKAASAKHVKEWTDDRVGRRSGEKLYNVLREPATLFPECCNRPILLITNPDIFYYAAFFQYNPKDRSNLASEFYGSFATVIFDEFHLYDAKQLVSLLFYLALSKEFRYFQYNRKIVLLTATPEPACEAALGRLENAGVKIAYINGETDGETETHPLKPSQTTVNLEIRQQIEKKSFVTEICNEVIRHLQAYPDQNGAVILDAKNTLGQVADELRSRGYADFCGRITGDTKSAQRHQAAQRQVILATSTVDVGFNFDRDVAPDRQNLDWLIFSSRDRFSFWQRIGRVGRVLGKAQTETPSEAVAYLPEQAWEQGIDALDCSGGRESLKQMLEQLDCMKRPFLDIYWRSEAFLEIAKPLVELEDLVESSPEASLIIQLYQTLQVILGGKRDWDFYRKRMKLLKGADEIASRSVKQIQKNWKYVKGGQNLVWSYLKAYCPEDVETTTPDELEKWIREDRELVENVLEYASILKASYAPLFRFRDSLFGNVKVYDPHYLLLDEMGETDLDPIHLLRFLEFESEGNHIELTARAEEAYKLAFSLQVEDLEDFKNLYLCRLFAFRNLNITRMQGDSTRPTDLPKALKDALHETLIPGVIVAEGSKNSWAIARLRKQGLDCYPLFVSSFTSGLPKQYLFFPSIAGILALAAAGVALKCPDEEYWIT